MTLAIRPETANPMIRAIERALEIDVPAYRLTGSHWAVPSVSEPGRARLVTDQGEGQYRCNCPAQGVYWHIGAVLIAQTTPPTSPPAEARPAA